LLEFNIKLRKTFGKQGISFPRENYSLQQRSFCFWIRLVQVTARRRLNQAPGRRHRYTRLAMGLSEVWNGGKLQTPNVAVLIARSDAGLLLLDFESRGWSEVRGGVCEIKMGSQGHSATDRS